MHENLGNHCGSFNGGEDVQGTAALWIGGDVDGGLIVCDVLRQAQYLLNPGSDLRSQFSVPGVGG